MRWLSIGLLLFLSWNSLFPQSPSGEALVLSLREKLKEHNFAEGKKIFRELFFVDSVASFRFAEEAENLFLNTFSEGDPPAEDIELVASVYGGAARRDKEQGSAWQAKRVLLINGHPEIFGNQLLHEAGICFLMDPLTCPFSVLGIFIAENAKAARAGILPMEKFVEAAEEIEKKLFERSILNRNEFQEAENTLRALQQECRGIIPTCSQAEKMFRNDFKKIQAGPEKVRFIFSILMIQNCGSSRFLSDTILPAMARQADDAWTSRRIALAWLSVQQPAKAGEWLSKALVMEKDPHLKATLFFWKHEIERMNGSPEKASEELEKAINAYPEWGDPYLAMALLIRDAAVNCQASAFDRKAAYWAAIDYCLIAMNSDPNAEQDAERVLFELMEKCPKPDELAHRGLKSGDSYPIHCWKEYITTVKVY